MGADLYIPKLRAPVEVEWGPQLDEAIKMRNATAYDVTRDAAQKLIDEARDKLYDDDYYFRDSYNSTSILHTLGLSWWQDMEYDIKEDGREINVSPDACRRFIAKIRAADQVLPSRTELESRHARVDDAGDNSLEGWHKYYRDKRELLIQFLERAAENGGMYASC